MNNFNFNHRVVLQKEKQVDSFTNSGIDVNFEIIAEVWANIVPIQQKQNFARMKNDVEISHNVIIRYREDAKECRRMIFNKRVFNVISVICPEENYNILLFNVKELV